jgi:UDP-GlcNAc3NAcA epimerase
MKILTIVGARPQFIKAAAVSYAFNAFPQIEELILHTGQHYDEKMSKIFFEELKIPKPKYNLNIGSLNHGAMTGRMIEGIENVCLQEKPDLVLVYGDTNSTLAGAIAASKLTIKLAHVESGLRSFNRNMPEETNRIIVDRISDFLFCPNENSISNLKNEGIVTDGERTVVNCGDVMFDSVSLFKDQSVSPFNHELENDFLLCTIHRAENTNDILKLKSIVDALNHISDSNKIVFPCHPRTIKILEENNIKLHDTILVTEPLSYLEMLHLIKNCQLVLTDSGGLQKEAYFLGKSCLILREETEWTELVDHGFNLIVGSDYNSILEGFNKSKELNTNFGLKFYGAGDSASLIANQLLAKL